MLHTKNALRSLGVLLIIALVVSTGALHPTSAQAAKKIALIIAQGGLGDRSYNDSAFAGLTKAAQDFGVEVKPIESPDPVGQAEQLLRSTADAGFDLVITLEFSHMDPLARIAPDYPNTLFSIVNTVVDKPNVVSIMFDEHTGSYLAGALAMLTATDKNLVADPKPILGVIGGVKSSGIDVFLYGYLQGACEINKDGKVLMAYSNGFGDPAKGKEMALAMFEQGARVVFQVAGGTGAGVIEAAKQKKLFAIGVDSDQDYLAPGSVLTSMLKRVDIAVYETIGKLVKGDLKGGTVLQYGLPVNGVGLSDMIYTRHLIPKDYMTKIQTFRQEIIDGKRDVIDIRKLTEDQFKMIDSDPTCAGLDKLRDALKK
jgi:basic membrane protein A